MKCVTTSRACKTFPATLNQKLYTLRLEACIYGKISAVTVSLLMSFARSNAALVRAKHESPVLRFFHPPKQLLSEAVLPWSSTNLKETLPSAGPVHAAQ